MAKKKKASASPEEDSEAEKQRREIEVLQLSKQKDEERIKIILANFSNVKIQKVELEKKLENQEEKTNEMATSLRREINQEKEQCLSLKKTNKDLSEKQKLLVAEYEKKIKDIQDGHNLAQKKAEEKFDGLNQMYQKISHFQDNMMKIENEMKDKDREIKQLKRAQNMITLELETRHLESTDHLKRDMNSGFEDTKEGLLAMTENQLHKTTKRTIMENENMENEIAFQTKETERIMKRNWQLQKDNKKLKQKIELLDDEQKMLVKRSNFYQKMNKRLSDKIKTLQHKAIAGRKSHEESEMAYRRQMESEVELMREHMSKLTNAYNSMKRDLNIAYAEIEANRKTSESVLGMQDEAVTFLLACMQDAKQQVQQKKYSDGMTSDDREAVLEMLLQKLNKKTALSPGKGQANVSFPPIAQKRRDPNSMT
mmetsp:Transcript_23850/g.38330  ORF Transcript_23850/g.38330 Transcript_23850/m.38330 type:complete len:426 (-) Transcript_23850:169-1446(-)